MKMIIYYDLAIRFPTLFLFAMKNKYNTYWILCTLGLTQPNCSQQLKKTKFFIGWTLSHSICALQIDEIIYFPLAGDANELAHEETGVERADTLWKYFTPRRHDAIKLFAYGFTKNELYDVLQTHVYIYMLRGYSARLLFAYGVTRGRVNVCLWHMDWKMEKTFHVCLLSGRE